jgi:filamentous hemagglutinin family protein
MKSLRKISKRGYFRQVVIYFLVWCLVLNTWLPAVFAEVVLDSIAHGDITVTPLGGGTTQDMTATDGAIGRFSDFDILAGNTVNCVQPGSNANALFRVFSGDGTQILGNFNANGNIYLVDPAGILFGANAQVNVNRLIASSLDISNEDFLGGRYEFFAGEGDVGAIVNNGTINAADGVALLGNKILNTGTITAGPGGFVVMAAGDRVLLGQPGSKVLVEMDSVTPDDPENPDNLGEVVNEYIDETQPGQITANGGKIVLAAGDIFSVPLHPQLQVNSGTPEEPVYDAADQPVRVEKGIGTVIQSGTIKADGIDGDGGSVVLTAGDNVVLSDGSLTTANGGTSNDSANGGEVIAYASEIYAPDNPGAFVDFQDGAQIEVHGGKPSDPDVLAPVDTEGKFEGGLAEISGDHLYFNGSVNAVSVPFNVPDPLNPGGDITITPEGGTVHVDPINLTLANGSIPDEGAAMDTFYETELENYSLTGVNTTLEADYDITVENITDGVIEGGKGDIALRTEYNNGSIVFEPATEGGPINTIVQTNGGGNIFMLAGSGGIKTGRLRTYEDGGNPGRIRIFTNNGGDIQTRSLTVDGGNDVEISVIASGDLTIDGSNDSTNLAGVRTYTNKVSDEENQTGTAYICLVSETGNVSIIGAVDVEAHGKQETVARIHICADGTVYVNPLNGRVRAVAKTSSEGTSDAEIRIHAGSEEPDAITIEGSTPIRLLANTTGSSIGPLDFSDAVNEYDQTSGGSHVFLQIANAWLEECPDCPTPPDLLPPIEPPQHSPIAVDDDYTINKGDIWVIIDPHSVLDNDYDPDDDAIYAFLFDGATTSQGGTIELGEDGGFTYTPPENAEFVWDGVSDHAEFVDTFIYYVEDEGGLKSNEATVTITATNFLPTGGSTDILESKNVDPITVQEGSVVTYLFDIGNDPDGDPVWIVPGSVTATTGTVTSEIVEDGRVIGFNYQPDLSAASFDQTTGQTTDYAQISYDVTDGYNTSTVDTKGVVDVDLYNLFPVGGSTNILESKNVDPITVQEGSVVTYLFDIGSDPDGDPVWIVPGSISTTAGTIVSEIEEGGKVIGFNYQPDLSILGPGSFDSSGHTDGYAQISYDVTDGYNTSTVETKGIVDVDLINMLPVAQPDSYQVAYGEPLSPTVDQGIITGVVPAENGDYDPDPGDSLTPYLPGDVVTGTTDGGGTITLNPDGSFSYTPPAGFSGSDSFTYYVTDGYNNSGSVKVTIYVGTMPTPTPTVAVPYIEPAPGLQREVLETSGCPALAKWVASELGTDEGKIEIWMANSLALGRDIPPCDACASLKEAATILQDFDGSHLAALAQVISQFASSTAPPTEEQMASIADAIANDVEGNVQYAAAGQYLDALAEYVGILTSEMGYSADQAVQLATDNYVQKLADGDNMGVASYVAARLAALAGS